MSSNLRVFGAVYKTETGKREAVCAHVTSANLYDTTWDGSTVGSEEPRKAEVCESSLKMFIAFVLNWGLAFMFSLSFNMRSFKNQTFPFERDTVCYRNKGILHNLYCKLSFSSMQLFSKHIPT